MHMPPMPQANAPTHGAAPNPANDQANDSALRTAARELEASFLAEMLKSAGVGKPRDGFGGGHGEDQFASFLRQEQAREMVKAGGIGLTEALFQSLKAREK